MLLRNILVDVLITDRELPDECGDVLIEVVARFPRQPKTIILLEEPIGLPNVMCRLDGFDLILPKPRRAMPLRTAIARLLQRPV